MCSAVLSINPTHVDNILSGKKRYEFRKIKCRRKTDRIIIYLTSPVMCVVGEAEVLNVIVGKPDVVWNVTSSAGINRSFFDKYFEGRHNAVAYELGNIKIYDPPFCLSDLGIANPPQ